MRQIICTATINFLFNMNYCNWLVSFVGWPTQGIALGTFIINELSHKEKLLTLFRSNALSALSSPLVIAILVYLVYLLHEIRCHLKFIHILD